MDVCLKIGEVTTLTSLNLFIEVVVSIYSKGCLRKLVLNDIVRLLAIGEKSELPGILGNLDCIHQKWKSCPTSWHVMYLYHIHKAKIVYKKWLHRICEFDTFF